MLNCLRTILILISVAAITGSTVPAADTAAFHFARQRYVSDETSLYPNEIYYRNWTTDYSDFADTSMEMHLESGLRRLTRIDVGKSVVLDFQDAGSVVFEYPLLYTVEPEQMVLRVTESALIREWLRRGGFWILDDFHGCEEMQDVLGQLRLVLAADFLAQDFKLLTAVHELCHTVLDLPKIKQVPWEGLVTSCPDDADCDRTWEAEPPCHKSEIILWEKSGYGKILLLHNNDTGDGLEHADLPAYPAEYTIYAYKFMVNAIVYALTH